MDKAVRQSDNGGVVTEHERRRLSLSAWIFIGMAAGAAFGLFFGEACAPLRIVGEAFVKLLQMTVLPYVVISLIRGFGSLSLTHAHQLLTRAGLVLLAFWGVTFGVLFLLPLSFPTTESGSFFSTAMVEPREDVDFLNFFIPSNPFLALTSSFVPAVVLFSISLGVALIRVDNKTALLEGLASLSDALVGVAKFMVRLTPFGVFAITASASGTMTVDEIFRLQVYFLSYNVAVLILTFWVLPMLVSVVTPIRYRDVISTSRAALLTAFATDSLFVVLPMLVADCDVLFQRRKLDSDETRTYTDVVIPVAFNFPNGAALLKLLFVLFVGWFASSPIAVHEYPKLVAVGTLSMFGGAKIAIPYLLDVFKLPADMFQLYLVTGIINARSGSMLGAMYLLTLGVVSTCAMTGQLQFRWRRLATALTTTVLITVVGLIGLRIWLDTSLASQGDTASLVRRMHLRQHDTDAVVRRSTTPDSTSTRPTESALERVRSGGVLRVGYDPESLPYCFFNADEQLVGLDVDLISLLANESGCRLEFIPLDRKHVDEQLGDGVFDIAISGIPITTSRLMELRFTVPYMDVTWALVVPDHRRHDFASLDSIARADGLRIGTFPDSYFRRKLHERFRRAEIVDIESPRDFFEADPLDVDALLFDAEGGSAWTLLYPDFHVVVPKPTVIRHPLAFAVSSADEELEQFLNEWIVLKQRNGAVQRLYDYWILGRDEEQKSPRWCVIRDVLKWVE